MTNVLHPSSIQVVVETRIGEYTPYSVFRIDEPTDFITQTRNRAIEAGHEGAKDIDHWDKARDYLEKTGNAKISFLNRDSFLDREDWSPIVMAMAQEVGWIENYLSQALANELGNDLGTIEKAIAERSIPVEKATQADAVLLIFEDKSSLKFVSELMVVLTPTFSDNKDVDYQECFEA